MFVVCHTVRHFLVQAKRENHRQSTVYVIQLTAWKSRGTLSSR